MVCSIGSARSILPKEFNNQKIKGERSYLTVGDIKREEHQEEVSTKGVHDLQIRRKKRNFLEGPLK